MRRNKLGHSGVEVSEICLGTMTFGQQNGEADAHAQLDHALARGVNFIDAAEMYPVPPRPGTQGRTEEIVGSWLSRGRRDRVVLATKITGPGRPLHWIRSGELAISPANVEAALEGSLRRLRTDYVDLYQIHWPDRYVPTFGETVFEPARARAGVAIREQLEALEKAVRAGKVRHVGLSNETPYGILEFTRLAREHGLPQVVSTQNAYHLLNRHFDGALAEVSYHTGVGLLAYSPLAFGFLSGKHASGPAPGSRVAEFPGFDFRYRKPNVDEAVRAYAELARAHGLSPAAMALAFVRTRFFVTSTIIGATTLAQLDENLSSCAVTLSPELLSAIDDVHARYPNPAP
jgi:aryl-alcohol dehydrogenase-like predicted oxidoreductase